MQNVIDTTDHSLDRMVGTPQVRPTRDGGNAGGPAAAGSNTIRPRRHVKARDLHPGDVVRQHDWSLHVREVDVRRAAVAIAVTEFGFPLHYAADEQLELAA